MAVTPDGHVGARGLILRNAQAIFLSVAMALRKERGVGRGCLGSSEAIGTEGS